MIEIAVAAYLAANVEGVTFDLDGPEGNTFIGHMPSTPDTAVMVTTNGGNPVPGGSLQPNDEPMVQILVRGEPEDPRGPANLAQAIYDQLVGLTSTRLDPSGPDDVWIVKTVAQQSHPVHIGRDDNDRHERSVNVAMFTDRPTVHRP